MGLSVRELDEAGGVDGVEEVLAVEGYEPVLFTRCRER